MTARQQRWIDASDRADRDGNVLAAGLFALIAQPNDRERTHSCTGHAVGFSRDGRRGFKCGVCRRVVRWIDQEGGAR